MLLAIAFGSSIILDRLVVKLFNTYKKNTYIDVKFIANDLRQQSIDPNVLLVLHALSGCDSTSYIRNITKEKLFQRFFDYPARYSSIIKLSYAPPSQDAIDTAEALLIRCYSFGCTVKSPNDLRGMSKCFQYEHHFFFSRFFISNKTVFFFWFLYCLFIETILVASLRIKDRFRKKVAASLPPSTMAFHQHCLRCSKQLKIWLASLESNSIPPEMSYSGYEYSASINRFKIKWSELNDRPNDFRLETCGDCKNSCTRCKCYKNNLSCTFFCKCKPDICSNRVRTDLFKPAFYSAFLFLFLLI